jgi:hypothetical protein
LLGRGAGGVLKYEALMFEAMYMPDAAPPFESSERDMDAKGG